MLICSHELLRVGGKFRKASSYQLRLLFVTDLQMSRPQRVCRRDGAHNLPLTGQGSHLEFKCLVPGASAMLQGNGKPNPSTTSNLYSGVHSVPSVLLPAKTSTNGDGSSLKRLRCTYVPVLASTLIPYEM